MPKRHPHHSHYIHRLSYSAQERLAGAFVLIALVVLVWLLVSSEQTQNLFEEEYTLYGILPDIQPINENTDVIVAGLKVVHVVSIDLNDDNTVTVSMAILKKYQRLIRQDSRASLINFKLAMVGKSAIDISVGNPKLPVLADGSKLPIEAGADLLKLVQKFEPVLASLQDSIEQSNRILNAIDPKTVSGLLQSAEGALKQAQQLLAAIDTQHVKQTMDDTRAISANARAISEQVASGHGVAGSVLYDPGLESDLKTSSRNLTDLTVQMKQLLHSLQQQVDDIPEITGKIKPLLKEADKTIKATQQIWPLSGGIRKENAPRLTTPDVVE